MKSLTQKDTKKYLSFGPTTQPFLSKELVQKNVEIDLENRKKRGIKASVLDSLCAWIASHLKVSSASNNKFERTAEEIWNSGYATGCTDYALVFATLSRQLNIPTTFLHTAEKGWVEALNSGRDFRAHYGHSFCECYYDGHWVLVDPANRRVLQNYDANLITLPYSIGPSGDYLPYLRALDLGKMTLAEHNRDMEKRCRV